ncbi:integrase core domain-containing protein [Neisseria sp.]|uniref:integrase core domain-containing protein n=1 Tax=Neisseria sp. TaxID=192066 RepID=UPI0026DD7FCE|nr:integrase core domain-containing protein [Neisseria sp.]MDO4907689.1 integrase core domain-containing protein [Neisseria sp.]
MNIHKNTRLTPHNRQAIWRAYTQDKISVTSLAQQYRVSRVTIYRILKAARLRLLTPQKSTNNRFKQAKYGMKRLAKVEREIEEKLKKQAKRYNKSYPGEMVHFDTKRLPLLQNQKATDPRDYLFVAIDDFSRELYAAILPDRTAASAAKFLLRDVIDCCPYTIECAYSDNGVEYRGNAGNPFGIACVQNNISQKFTRVARPQTNGKAERVIRTLMEMWHDKHPFKDSAHRQKELCRFANFYNTVKPHKSLKGDTPFEVLQAETFAKIPKLL